MAIEGVTKPTGKLVIRMRRCRQSRILLDGLYRRRAAGSAHIVSNYFGRTDSTRSCLPCDRSICRSAGHGKAGFRSLRTGSHGRASFRRAEVPYLRTPTLFAARPGRSPDRNQLGDAGLQPEKNAEYLGWNTAPIGACVLIRGGPRK